LLSPTLGGLKMKKPRVVESFPEGTFYVYPEQENGFYFWVFKDLSTGEVFYSPKFSSFDAAYRWFVSLGKDKEG
jgi:hypothetical protein